MQLSTDASVQALKAVAPRAMTPRPYQVEAIDAAFANWRARPNSSQIIVAPTGSGKTLLAGMAAERYLDDHPGERVLVLVHVPELVMQNHATFRKMCPSLSSGIYAAKLGRKDKRAKVTFALVQSVARNVEAFTDVGLIIIDECHLIPHSSDGQYKQVIGAIRQARGNGSNGNGGVRILGMTATPYRLNSGNLLEPYKGNAPLFDEVAYDIDMLDLLEAGHLCKVVTRSTKMQLNVSGVHKRGGEFVDKELDERCNTDVINEQITSEIVAAGMEQSRKSWLVFAVSVDHAQRLAQLIEAKGISCACVWGEMPMVERTRIIQAFCRYQIRCLTSVNVLATGFDHKGVDLIAMCRPTASPGLYLQQAGRALRPLEGKQDALLLDFSGNVFRHGLLTNVRGVHKKDKVGAQEEVNAYVKTCPECRTVIPAAKRTCDQCGYTWPSQQQRREEQLTGHNQAERVMDDLGGWARVLDARYRTTRGRDGKPGVFLLSYVAEMSDGAQVDCSEVFCFDHEPQSWARKRATQEWMRRTGSVAPSSIIEAVTRVCELKRPTQVRIQRSDDGRYLNVRGVKYTPLS